jgi:hypothetical protein
MKLICKQDIVGARVTDIHASYEELYGCDCTTIYFTVDRGFTFNLPCPGHEWLRVELPPDAEPLPDEYGEESFRVKKGWWFGTKFVQEPSRKIDIVKRIKERVIAGVYCPKPDEGLESYEPDDAFLVFDDGSRFFA